MKINPISNQSFGKLYIAKPYKKYLDSRFKEMTESYPKFRNQLEYIKNNSDANIWVKDDGEVYFEIQNWMGNKGSIYKDKAPQNYDVWEKFRYAVYSIDNIKGEDYKKRDNFDETMNNCCLNAIASWNYPGAYSGFYGSGWGGF